MLGEAHPFKVKLPSILISSVYARGQLNNLE
jgi:hypothetical protein